MAVKRRTNKRRDELTDDARAWLEGRPCGFFEFKRYDELVPLWEKIRRPGSGDVGYGQGYESTCRRQLTISQAKYFRNNWPRHSDRFDLGLFDNRHDRYRAREHRICLNQKPCRYSRQGFKR